MSFKSDFLLRALDHNLQTGVKQVVEASAMTNPDNEHHRYYCNDCDTKGRRVRLKYVQSGSRTQKFGLWDKQSGEQILDKDGAEKIVEKTFRAPPHFDRWPGAEEHKCDNPVRYSQFQSFAYQWNATQIGPFQNIFSIGIPGVRWHHDQEAKRGDLRRSFRPLGLGLGGIDDPEFFPRFAEFCKKDPGLQSYQHFHDGLQIRAFDETYFESVAALQDFLQRRNAQGRAGSIVVAYLMNPNTSQPALRDEETRGGFIDRSMPKSEDGNAIKLFLRGGNQEAQENLKKQVLSKGLYGSTRIVVLGEAYLNPDKPHQVEIGIFKPEQVCAWKDPYHFFPQKKASGISRVAEQVRQATLAL